MLEIRSLVKVYPGPVTALKGVDLDVPVGMFGLLGPNGAGKSTFMKILAGLLEPTSGTVLLDGQDILGRPERVRSRLGYLPQEFGFYPHLSGEQMLLHLLRLKDVSAPGGLKALAGELLERVNLSFAAKRPVRSYSGGMRQRLGIAQAIAGDPRLVIVDEPTAGLDPEERLRFYHLLAELAESRIVLLSTHIVEDVAVLCPQFAVIRGGQLVARTTPRAARAALHGAIWEHGAARRPAGAARRTPRDAGRARGRPAPRAGVRTGRPRARGLRIGHAHARGRLPGAHADGARAAGGRPGPRRHARVARRRGAGVPGGSAVVSDVRRTMPAELETQALLDATPRGPDRTRGAARAFEVFRQEFTHNLRRPLFWVLIVILAFFAWMLSTGEASIRSGDARVGGTKAWITSEFAIAQLLIMLVGILYSFFVSVGAGMSLIRDGELKVGELLHATRLTAREYVWGKFFAQLASFAGVLGVHLLLMALFNHVAPHGENRDSIGPFALAHYLRPALIFALPALTCLTGVSFAVGGLARKPVLVFALPLVTVLFGAFFLWSWSPAWLSPAVNRLLQFVDLTGLRWMNETWLNVDKGVDWYNRRPVGLDTLVIAQRLLCVALGLASVALMERRFAATLRGAARARRAPASAATAAPTRHWPARCRRSRCARARPASGAARSSGASSGRVKSREAPELYLFVPMILLQVFGSVVDGRVRHAAAEHAGHPRGQADEHADAARVHADPVLHGGVAAAREEHPPRGDPLRHAAAHGVAAAGASASRTRSSASPSVRPRWSLRDRARRAAPVPVHVGPFARCGAAAGATFLLWTRRSCAAPTA